MALGVLVMFGLQIHFELRNGGQSGLCFRTTGLQGFLGLVESGREVLMARLGDTLGRSEATDFPLSFGDGLGETGGRGAVAFGGTGGALEGRDGTGELLLVVADLVLGLLGAGRPRALGTHHDARLFP